MKRLPAWLLLPVSFVLPVQCVLADCVYGIVIDRSGSMRPAVDQAVTAVRLLIEKAGPHDRFFLVAFHDEITLEQETTDQKEKIERACCPNPFRAAPVSGC